MSSIGASDRLVWQRDSKVSQEEGCNCGLLLFLRMHLLTVTDTLALTAFVVRELHCRKQYRASDLPLSFQPPSSRVDAAAISSFILFLPRGNKKARRHSTGNTIDRTEPNRTYKIDRKEYHSQLKVRPSAATLRWRFYPLLLPLLLFCSSPSLSPLLLPL